MIVGTDDSEVERALVAGEVECPDCGGRLGRGGGRGGGWFVGRAVTIDADRVGRDALAAPRPTC